MTPTVTLTAETDRRAVATEVSSARTIEWQISVPPPAQHIQRAALNLALVLDRSGSMSGDKLAYVKQAACHLLDGLNVQDRIAVVTYDDEVTLVVGSQPVTETGKQDLKAKIHALQVGGWTNLSGGWLEGCRQVAGWQLPQGVNRALLLTDGLANRGITDIEDLTHHARELRQRGVSTSTFGVGLDFNEQLLEALAAQGGGNFHYIGQPQQIPDVFRKELGDLLTVVAREAFLSLPIPKGVSLELLGDLPHERSGDRLRIFLGDLAGGTQQALYTRVLLPPDALGTSVVLTAELGYADLDNHAQTVTAQVPFAYLREAQVLLLPHMQAILQRAAEVELAAVTAQALQLERAGQRQQARAVLQQAIAMAPAMPAPAAATYKSLAEDMGQGLSEEQRKQTHFDTYKGRLAKKSSSKE